MNYDPENIFAKILSGAVPCEKVYENDEILAFKDIHPKAKVHVLVVPKTSSASFQDFSKLDPITVGNFFKFVNFVATEVLNLNDNFRLVVNNGKKSGQEVFHFHVHIISN